ncbi:hypothetical protein AB9M75_08065 [Lactobacillus sp. AN1001]
MRFDVIDAIESYNDPNSCYQPSDDDDQLYTVRIYKDTLLEGQTIYDIVDLTQERIGERKKILENMLEETKKELAKVEYEELTLKSEYNTKAILKIAGNYFPDDAIEEG